MMNTKTGKLIVFLIAAVALLLLPIILQSTGSNSWVRIVDIALMYVLLALGLNIVVGYAGLLDLGYIAFFAVGAYVFALLGSPTSPTPSRPSRPCSPTACTTTSGW